jgi:hypothetical protein
MVTRLLLIATVLLGSIVVVPASWSVERGAVGPWTGTVTVVEDVDVTYDTTTTTGIPLTIHTTYHDQASYTLSGETTSDGLSLATMAGSGVGRLDGTSSTPNVCVVPQDPFQQWSYSGAANVSISYTNGAYVVLPQAVDTIYTYVDRFPACPGSNRSDETRTRSGPGPAYIAQLKPKGQAAAADATALVGSEELPLTYAGVATAGKATLSWNLSRTGSTPPAPTGPPTGTPSGTVLVDGKPYTSGQPIAYGSTVDVTKGRLTLKTEAGTLTVFGGGVSAVFKLLRLSEKGKTLVELRLVNGDFSVCKRAFRMTSATKPPKKTVRRLWATGKGRFRTRGRYSAATVRGTNWLTADRCDGTLTQVKQGKVEVRDFVKNKRVLLTAGKSYLAVPK